MQFKYFSKKLDNQWIQQLDIEKDYQKHEPNRKSREVKQGHYVLVKPDKLNNVELIITSKQMLQELEISEEDSQSDEFLQFFSGNTEIIEGFDKTWATPYALSIYGQEMYDNCPFGTGNGYGDGRAISIGEIINNNGKRYELQLKGGGQTPFCRGADGRAVLRSSVREFLASEAMHNLGVETTRALCLIYSKTDKVQRPWYKSVSSFHPDTMIPSFCAITTRAANSFLRVGHIELFSRRVQQSKSPQTIHELNLIINHLIYKEYPQIQHSSLPFSSQVFQMLQQFGIRLSTLIANWLRVGFVQGNFNSDNCLASGRTMDYGPFGFMEKFEPFWNMWENSGNHFGFINQPQAAFRNYHTFVEAVGVILEDANQLQQVLKEFQNNLKNSCENMWNQKMGTSLYDDQLFTQLIQLMATSQVDYTIFWRQLSEIPQQFDKNIKQLFKLIEVCFYTQLDQKKQEQWYQWLEMWLQQLNIKDKQQGEQLTKKMKKVNPKYVPREWMLNEAYRKAEDQKDFTEIHKLYNLFLNPYDEQETQEANYYKKAPIEIYQNKGRGIYCMSCSS